MNKLALEVGEWRHQIDSVMLSSRVIVTNIHAVPFYVNVLAEPKASPKACKAIVENAKRELRTKLEMLRDELNNIDFSP